MESLASGGRSHRVRARRVVGSLAIFVLAFTLTDAARADARLADGRGADLRLFRPPVDADGFLTVNGSDVLRPFQVSAIASLDVGFELLPTRNFEWSRSDLAASAQHVDEVVDTVATGVLTLDMGFLQNGLLGVSLPVVSVSGPNTVVPGLYNDRSDAAPTPLGSTGLGDLELHGKWSFSQARLNHFGFGTVLRVDLPTGESDAFRGEPGASVWPSIVFEYATPSGAAVAPLPVLRFGAELGYRYVGGDGARLSVGQRIDPAATAPPELRYQAECGVFPTTASCPGSASGGSTVVYDDLVTAGIAASVNVARRVVILADLYATAVAPALSNGDAYSSELALAGRYQFDDYFAITLGGAIGLFRGARGAGERLLFSVAYAPAPDDFDGDGLSTRDDACPREPEDFDRFEDSDGCPDPDDDRDGIADAVDACPNDPEDRDGVDDNDGCPEGAIPDSDGDGVNDYLDPDSAPAPAPRAPGGGGP